MPIPITLTTCRSTSGDMKLRGLSLPGYALCLWCLTFVISHELPHQTSIQRTTPATKNIMNFNDNLKLSRRLLQSKRLVKDADEPAMLPAAKQHGSSIPVNAIKRSAPKFGLLASSEDIDQALLGDAEAAFLAEAELTADGVRRVANFAQLNSAVQEGSPLIEITEHIRFASHQTLPVNFAGSSNIAIWGRCLQPPDEEDYPEGIRGQAGTFLGENPCVLSIPGGTIDPITTMITARSFKLKNIWLSNIVLAERGQGYARVQSTPLRGMIVTRSRLWLTQMAVANFGGTAVGVSGNDAIFTDVLFTRPRGVPTKFNPSRRLQQDKEMPTAALTSFASRSLDLLRCTFLDSTSNVTSPAIEIVAVSPVLTVVRLEETQLQESTMGRDTSVGLSVDVSAYVPQVFSDDSLVSDLLTSDGREATMFELSEWSNDSILRASDYEWLDKLVQTGVPGAEMVSARVQSTFTRPPAAAERMVPRSRPASQLSVAIISSLVTCLIIFMILTILHKYTKRKARENSNQKAPYASLPVDSAAASAAASPATGLHTNKSNSFSPTFLSKLQSSLDKVIPSRTAPVPANFAWEKPTRVKNPLNPMRGSNDSSSASIPLDLVPPSTMMKGLPAPKRGNQVSTSTTLYSDGNFAVLHKPNLRVKL